MLSGIVLAGIMFPDIQLIGIVLPGTVLSGIMLPSIVLLGIVLLGIVLSVKVLPGIEIQGIVLPSMVLPVPHDCWVPSRCSVVLLPYLRDLNFLLNIVL